MQIPTGSMSDTIIPFIWFCVAAIGVCVFRCVSFGLRTFLVHKYLQQIDKEQKM